MSMRFEALFLGGPRDGQRKALLCVPQEYDVLKFDLSALNDPLWDYGTLPPPVKYRYEKTHVTASGVHIYEPVEDEKFYFVVEVDAVAGASEQQAEHILGDLLTHIDGHHEAFPSGIKAARVDPPKD